MSRNCWRPCGGSLNGHDDNVVGSYGQSDCLLLSVPRAGNRLTGTLAEVDGPRDKVRNRGSLLARVEGGSPAIGGSYRLARAMPGRRRGPTLAAGSSLQQSNLGPAFGHELPFNVVAPAIGVPAFGKMRHLVLPTVSLPPIRDDDDAIVFAVISADVVVEARFIASHDDEPTHCHGQGNKLHRRAPRNKNRLTRRERQSRYTCLRHSLKWLGT